MKASGGEMKSVRPAKFQEDGSNRVARGPPQREFAPSAQRRVDCFFKVLEHLVHSRIALHIVPELDES